MSLRSRVNTWWKAMSQPAKLRDQVRDELEFHIETYAEDLMRNGMPRAQAMRRARAELGSIAAGSEQCRSAWGTRFVDDVRADLRFAARMLARSPGFTAIAIGSLALGIGANTVIFTAAQHMLLDRLSVPHPEQLRLFAFSEGRDGIADEMWGEFDSEPGGGQRGTSFTYPVYQALRKQNHALRDICAFKPLNRQTVSVNAHPEALSVELVSGNYYSTLVVRPQLGRAIEDVDDREVGSGPVALISDRFWTSHFGRSPDVIGKTVLVNSVQLTIVGVNPAGFTGAYSPQETPDIFLPFSMQPVVAPLDFDDGQSTSLLANKTMWWVLMMGRTRPGVSDATSTAALNVSFRAAVRATLPVKDDAQLPRLYEMDGSRGQNPSAGELSKPIYVLMGLSGLVLLLACANLANLLLARASGRLREMGVRLAMGAGRRRILRQMLTESLTLSTLGGLAGLALAFAVRDAIPRMMSNSWTPPAFTASFNWRIFAFAAGISVLTGLVFGVAPAWAATRVQVSSSLQDSALTATNRRRGIAGKSLVILQVALSTVLVIGAGLFTRTLMQLGHATLGFNPDHLLLFSLEPPQTRYPKAADIALYQQLEEKVSAIPGVEQVTVMLEPLISGGVSMHGVLPAGEKHDRNKKQSALYNSVGKDFFSMLEIPIIAGRSFDATDTRSSEQVAVVSQDFVKEFYPGKDPIGATFDEDSEHPRLIRIVGVCGDTKYPSLRREHESTFYTPYWQSKDGLGRATFALRTSMSTAALAPQLQRAVQSIDGTLPVLDTRTQNEQIAATVRNERIIANLAAVFGGLALTLASIGIYGILAYSVSRRTSEIGIRMALGARPGMVLGMVLREAAWMALIGVIAGLGSALAMGRLIATMLYGLKPWDPATLAAAAAALTAVALAASWIPARRAATIDPMHALRHE